jgi:hypothetical protein
MRKDMHVVCLGCGAHGPDAPTAPSARTTAQLAGWLIGMRPRRGEDYCPSCRPQSGLQPCAVPHRKGPQSLAVYKMTSPSAVVFTCGIHAQQVMRELFASGTDVVAVTKIRSYAHGD